jgi:hypothetical protein
VALDTLVCVFIVAFGVEELTDGIGLLILRLL